MLEKTITITATKGIHLQPAMLISRYALQRKELNIRFIKDKNEVSATSVMSILSLELSKGSSVTIRLDQEDAEAIHHIQGVLEGTVTE
ncbi:phosphocarrier protein HPr [Spirochaetota bacterium]|nr:phosphocarrier protein HPr [Spirochaetota bacterium]